ncbi:LysR family transcriptional regulator [Paracidovorax cattleyae]|uniref:DNA-binding transcriptional regulator, LysR family n=1 Tax=Paracidovorax cattleyae TaxID=80868 RepID=A0A1H0WRN4_9BURK|nr:LysR family transcriptional regulator [Paracidovorax cattleyae]MBF9263332.1 LysR family transcriptional regulator [Paracidovorax cattleyae]SDP93311.1 DNA-binding transcriptional regulator, LysR family [Paracidovorax cattleyae]
MWVFSRFVRYFDEAARQGSMRKAGDTLHVASSSVDRQILKIEEEIGVPLFERQPQGLKLTSAGELVLHSLRKWQNEMHSLQSRIEDLKGLKRGNVVLATIEGAASEFVASAAMDFHQSYPAVTFELQVYGAHRVTDAVLSGDVDFGLTINPRLTPGLAVMGQKNFRVGAVVAPDHPLAIKEQVRLSDCLPYKVVVAEASLDLRLIVNQILARASARPELIASSNSIMLMKELVMRGMGVGLMTEMDADKEVRAGQMVYVPLADRPIPPSILSLCVNSERQLSLPATTLLQVVKGRLEGL